MSKYKVLLGVLFIILICCRPKQSDAQKKNKTIKKEFTENSNSNDSLKGVALLEKCLEAYGGLKQWKKFEGLEYNLNDNGKMVYQLTHLKDRRAFLKSKNYTVGYDGKVAWALPDASKVSGGSAAFYYNLDFYFMGIPFLLTDPGVHVLYSGKALVNGKSYESLKITFGSGIGFTPEDVYYVYLDPESYIMQILTYSISYFDKKNAEVNSAKVYSGWQEVQGLLMPSKMENFIWENGKIGESKNHLRVFDSIKFLEKIEDQSIFSVPRGAIIEQLK